jgi:acetyl esterase/lipase
VTRSRNNPFDRFLVTAGEHASIDRLLVALGRLFASTACRKQAAYDAQARAEAYGVSTVRSVRDVVYATYGQRQVKRDVYRPPASLQQGVGPGVIAVGGGAYNLQMKEAMRPEVIRAVTDFIGAPLEAHADTITAASPIAHVSRRSAPLLLPPFPRSRPIPCRPCEAG